jgi:hypothetical protein
MIYGQGRPAKLKKNGSLRILYRICTNMMPLPVFIDIPHCYNKEVVSVGTHLNFYYNHDSSIPFLSLLLLIAGSIHCYTCSLECLSVIFLIIKPLGFKKCNSILQIKVISQKWNIELCIVKMSTKLHWTSSESHNQCVRVTSYVYASTVIREMSKMLLKVI